MMETRVIVVGGAVAGASVANAFGTRGVPTLLLEKVSREVHSTRGDLLHPPTLRILERWGVLEALHRDGALPITELAVSDRGGIIAHFPVHPLDDGPAGRTLAVPHDRIEAVLYECATRWHSVRAERGVVTDVLFADDGRARGVRFRPHGTDHEIEFTAPLVVGCDGSRSLVRRALEIEVDEEPYNHEQVIIGGLGEAELPAALHWYVDDVGALCVVNRPRGGFRILLTFKLGERADILKRPDPALRDFVASRFVPLARLRFGKADAYLYRLSRLLARRFVNPGVALVGDSAHTTHPAGATGMSLAITGAERLAEMLAAAVGHADQAAVDAALAAYEAERRSAARVVVEANHERAMKIWGGDVHRDPREYARWIDPETAWGPGGAGWGRDPAGLALGSAEKKAT